MGEIIKKLNKSLRILHHIYCKILGLSPWTVNNNDNMCSTSFVGSYYNILLIFLFILLSFSELFGDVIAHAYSGTLFPLIRVKVLFVILLSASSIPLFYIIQQKKFIELNNQLLKVDALLKKSKAYQLKDNQTNVAAFIGCSLSAIFLAISWELFNHSIMRVLFANFATVISGAVIMQYVIILDEIEKRLKSINSSISKLPKPKVYVVSSQVISVTEKVLLRESVLYDIENFERAYIKLYKIACDAAQLFGVPILITLLCCAERTLFTLYRMILSVLELQNFDIVWPVYILRLLLFSFLVIISTSSITSIKKQNSKLAKTLTLLIDRSVMDDRIIEKLSYFSSDLSDLKIELTACDIIPLDRTLLGIGASAIAMYLVIGVQFSGN